MTQSVTFDTHAYVKKLEAAGFSEKQAEAQAEAQKEILSEVLNTTLATKGDINRLEKTTEDEFNRLEKGTKEEFNRLDKELLIIRGELKLLKGMTGIMLAGVISLVLKSFFL